MSWSPAWKPPDQYVSALRRTRNLKRDAARNAPVGRVGCWCSGRRGVASDAEIAASCSRRRDGNPAVKSPNLTPGGANVARARPECVEPADVTHFRIVSTGQLALRTTCAAVDPKMAMSI